MADVFFPQKKPNEVKIVSFDFNTDQFVSPTETILTSTWTAVVISGIDPTPNAILGIAPTISNKTVSNIITGGVNGVSYSINCVVTTSLGQTLSMSGSLVVNTGTASTKIASRQGLIDYCMRKLGAPLINIEIDESQLEDGLTDALQHFQEYHFDGIMRDYYVHRITATTIQLVSTAGFAVGDTLQVWDTVNATVLLTAAVTKITAINQSTNTITIIREIGLDKFVVGQTLTNAQLSFQSVISVITLGDVDNGWIPIPDGIVGVNTILNITNILGSADYMFNMQYQIMMTELQALTKAGASTYYQTMNYLGHLDFIMKKEKNFSFNRRTNKLFLEISWATDVAAGDMVAAEVYRIVDPDQYSDVYNDQWLKKYTTAILKKQWGANIKKYTGMALPGGLTYNGQQIFDEALAEIKILDAEALDTAAPLNWLVG